MTLSLHLPRHLAIALLAGVCAGNATSATLSLWSAATAAGAGATPVIQTLTLPDYDGQAHTLSTAIASYGSVADGWITASAGSFSGIAHAHARQAVGYTGGGSLRPSVNERHVVTVQDQLLVTSATLAFGTPVDLTFSLGYNGTTSYVQSPDPVTGPSMWMGGLVVFTLDANPTSGAQPLNLALITNQGLPAGPTSDFASGVVHSTVGATINFQQKLDMQADATYFDSEDREVTVDFSHTFKLYADPALPGVSLVSQSGHNYSVSAVPEPGHAALLLLGMGLLGVRKAFAARKG